MSATINLNSLTTEQLREAVTRLGDLQKDPAKWEAFRTAFTQVEFVSVDRLHDVLVQSKEAGAKHVKLYNALDETGSHFFFLAPITADGRALDGSDTVATMCCCSKPPCPDTVSDRYYTTG